MLEDIYSYWIYFILGLLFCVPVKNVISSKCCKLVSENKYNIIEQIALWILFLFAFSAALNINDTSFIYGNF